MKSFNQFLNEWSYTSKEIRPYLEKKGYKFLGKGVDQQAYLDPKSGDILKVFGTHLKDRSMQGFTQDHLMFKAWVDYCDRHKGNKFLPRFRGWEPFEYDDQTYLQIRMERLVGKESRPMRLAASWFGYMINSGHTYQELLDPVVSKKLKAPRAWEQLIVLLGDDMPLFYDTLKDLAAMRKSHGWGWDLHDDNFMFRNDGTPVIVDPFIVFSNEWE